jgi:hypothetical protein
MHVHVQAQNCEVQATGSALISTASYQYGQFEFDITPSMPVGMLTAFGLSYEGESTFYSHSYV